MIPSSDHPHDIELLFILQYTTDVVVQPKLQDILQILRYDKVFHFDVTRGVLQTGGFIVS